MAVVWKTGTSVITEKKHSIFWFGCIDHTLNLLIKDIVLAKEGCLQFVVEIYKKGMSLVKYIRIIHIIIRL